MRRFATRQRLGTIRQGRQAFARQPIDPEKLRAWFNWSSELGTWSMGLWTTTPAGSAQGSHNRSARISSAGRRPRRRGSTGDSPLRRERLGYCRGIGPECDRSAHGEHVWYLLRVGAAYCLGEIGVGVSPTGILRSPACGAGQRPASRGESSLPPGPVGVTCFIGAKGLSWQSGESPRDGKTALPARCSGRSFFMPIYPERTRCTRRAPNATCSTGTRERFLHTAR